MYNIFCFTLLLKPIKKPALKGIGPPKPDKGKEVPDVVNIAVMGHGVVGSGVVELLLKNHDSIAKKTAGVGINVKYILDLRDFKGTAYDEKFIKDFNVILNDEDIKIVVEVMGGCHPAFEYATQLMERGKCVVTSNKELVAQYGAELLDTAKKNNVSFLFEASVGGGIPIIRPLHQCLAANEISEIAGILNGTTNYILTKMFKDGIGFDEALSQAQELGYAERNPAADVEGHDACRKICILASLSFGNHIYPDEIKTVGITAITGEDVAYAERYGGVIKLIGRAKLTQDGRVSIRTTPAVLSRDSQLANVDDVFNGILVRGDAIGDCVFYGKGAGKMPTASAVVADVIDQTKHVGRVPKRIFWDWPKEGQLKAEADCAERQMIRASFPTAGIGEKQVNDLFGPVDFVRVAGRPDNELCFVTGEMTYGKLEETLSTLKNEAVKVLSVIPVLEY